MIKLKSYISKCIVYMGKLISIYLKLTSTIRCTSGWVDFHNKLSKRHPSIILSTWPVKVIVLGWTMRMHEFARDIFIFQIDFVNKDYPPVTIEQARCVVVGLKGLLHLL